MRAPCRTCLNLDVSFEGLRAGAFLEGLRAGAVVDDLCAGTLGLSPSLGFHGAGALGVAPTTCGVLGWRFGGKGASMRVAGQSTLPSVLQAAQDLTTGALMLFTTF